MRSKPIDMKYVFKRERSIFSNKYQSLSESTIDYDTLDKFNNLNSINKNQVIRIIDEAKSYKSVLKILESLYEQNEFRLLEESVQKMIRNIIPCLKKGSYNDFISSVNESSIGDINKDKLTESAKMYKSIDRILDNHKKLSKRFDLSFYNSAAKNDREKINQICEFVDTYNGLSPFIKFNIALEELVYLGNVNGNIMNTNSIVEFVTDYFLLRNENSESDIQSYKRALIESKVIDDMSLNNVDYLTENKERDEFYVESFMDKINDWKLNPEKNVDGLVNIFKENYSDINRLNYVYNILEEYIDINDLDPVSISSIIRNDIDNFNLRESTNMTMLLEAYGEKDDTYILDTLKNVREAEETDSVYDNCTPDEPMTFTTDQFDTVKMHNLISDSQKAAEFIANMDKSATKEFAMSLNQEYNDVNTFDRSNIRDYVDENDHVSILLASYKSEDNKDINMNFIESVTGCLNNILSNTDFRAYYVLENSNCDIYLKSKYKVLLTLKEEYERSFPYSMKARILELNDILENASIYESKIFNDIMDKMHNRSYAANITDNEYRLLKESLYGIVDEGVFEDFINLCKEEANPEYDKFNKYSTNMLESTNYNDNMSRLQFCAQLMNIPYENENGDIVQEAVDFNNLRLAWQGFKSKIKHLGAKEKEASRDLDASFNNLLKGLKSAFTTDHREQIITGQINPSLSRILKIGVALAGLGVAAHSIYVPALAAVAGLALSKHTEKKERALILDEIDIELKVLDRELQKAESGGSTKKYRALLTIQKNLQRERQRIYYGLASKGKRIPMPSTMGLRSGKGD